MNWKETYTKVFLKQKNLAISEVTLKQYMSEWWQDTRAKSKGGLRLTDAGCNFVRNQLDLATYDVPFPKDFELTTNTIIWLDSWAKMVLVKAVVEGQIDPKEKDINSPGFDKNMKMIEKINSIHNFTNALEAASKALDES